MRHFHLLAAFLSVLFIGASAGARTVNVYRNDSSFNRFCSEKALRFEYSDTGEPWILKSADAEIPVEAVDSIVVRDVDVPELRFTFPDYPDADWVFDKDNYILAGLEVIGNGMADSMAVPELKVKGRGNSTWRMPKKPMRLKFNKKTELCGFKASKSFVLLQNYLDPTLMKNALSLWLADKLGMPFTNHSVPCHVYVNDRYAGAYLLTEKIGIGKASVDIDEETGILFEMSTEFDEPYKFRSTRYNMPVMVKDPDFDELEEDNPEGPTAQERLALWENDYNEAEKGIAYGKALDYFDLDSFIGFIIVNNLAGNDEIGFPKSCYIFKEAPGTEYTYKFGPVWDFDAAYNFYRKVDGEIVSNDPESSLWLCALHTRILQSAGVLEEYCRRYISFYENIFPEMLEWIDTYVELIEPLALSDGVRWNEPYDLSWNYRKTTPFTLRNNVLEFKGWLEKRALWLYGRALEGKL